METTKVPQLKTIEIKGKPYVQVHERILYLSENADYKIETYYEFFPDDKMFIVKAVLTIHKEHGERVYTGHAQEIIDEGYINKTSALENCETSAVGRACGMAGIGIISGFASADEVQKAHSREKDHKPWMSESQKNEILRLVSEGEIEKVNKNLDAFKIRKTYRAEIDEALKDAPEKAPDEFAFNDE